MFHSNEYNWAWLCCSSIIHNQPETWSNILNLQSGIIPAVTHFSMSVFLTNTVSLIQTSPSFFILYTAWSKSAVQKSHVFSLFLLVHTHAVHTLSMVTQRCIGGFDSVQGEFSGTDVIKESCEGCITNNHHYKASSSLRRICRGLLWNQSQINTEGSWIVYCSSAPGNIEVPVFVTDNHWNVSLGYSRGV